MSQRRVRAAVIGIAALSGLVLAAIVTLNVHIIVGLEQGYAATPAEVFDRSVLLGVFDLLLLFAGPAAAVLFVRRLLRVSGHGSTAPEPRRAGTTKRGRGDPR